MDARITPPAQQDNLVALADRIRAEHEAVAIAMRNGVTHALEAGDALGQAQSQVPSGQWARWLKEAAPPPVVPTTISTMEPTTDASATVVARAVPSSRPKVAEHLADVFERLDPEDRTDELKLLLEEVTLKDVLAAMPSSWKVHIEDRVLSGWRSKFSDRKVQAAIQTVERAITSDRLRDMKPAGRA